MSRKRAAPSTTCRFDLPGSSPEPPASPPSQLPATIEDDPTKLQREMSSVKPVELDDLDVPAAAVPQSPVRVSGLPMLIPGSPLSNKDKYNLLSCEGELFSVSSRPFQSQYSI